MKLIEFDGENNVISFSNRELSTLLSMARVIDSEYEHLDADYIGCTKERIAEIAEALFAVSNQAR